MVAVVELRYKDYSRNDFSLEVIVYMILLLRGGGIVRGFFFASRSRHTRWPRDWSSDVCSSDLDSKNGDALVGHVGLLMSLWVMALFKNSDSDKERNGEEVHKPSQQVPAEKEDHSQESHYLVVIHFSEMGLNSSAPGSIPIFSRVGYQNGLGCPGQAFITVWRAYSLMQIFQRSLQIESGITSLILPTMKTALCGSEAEQSGCLFFRCWIQIKR